jgi:diguanylate cyclase (GGDEF)-like protein
MHSRVLPRLLIALLAVTVVALAGHAWGMNTTLAWDARSPGLTSTFDDRATPQGRSVARATYSDGGLGLECRIEAGAAAPFCELRVEIGKEAQDVALDRYDVLRVWMTATGPEARQLVRIALHSVDAADGARAIGQIVYEPAAHPAGHALPLDRFVAAPPASADGPTPLPDARAGRKLALLAFATAPRAVPGVHTLRVDRIELTGKLIPAAPFRLGLIVLWVLAVGGYLAFDAVARRGQVSLSAASQYSLQRLNESLLLEARSLADIARTDPLTGGLNRKGLVDELARLVRMNGDSVFPLSLVFIDIDRFKRVNDAHGHDVGDQLIRGLADLVRSAVQRDDLFGRWGGEEFLVVFRNTPGLEGRNIAQRLRDRVAGAQWPHGLRMTCSFGVAEWQRGEDVAEGVRRADEAMYRAKQNGRDRVELELERVDASARRPLDE